MRILEKLQLQCNWSITLTIGPFLVQRTLPQTSSPLLARSEYNVKNHNLNSVYIHIGCNIIFNWNKILDIEYKVIDLTHYKLYFEISFFIFF